MKLSDFDYSFPPELVAQHPLEERDASRMMVLNRASGLTDHHVFKNFPDYFEEGDVLVLNNSKVFPCRLVTERKTGGRVEVFLLREVKPKVWSCLVSPNRRISAGSLFQFSDDLGGKILDESDDVRTIRLSFEKPLFTILEKIGHVPLPPYIGRPDDGSDLTRYQTVYAGPTGSVAAPTAGFHFTPPILEALKGRGVQVVSVTLHVGIGTFLPIRTETVEEHRMHGEFYGISEEVTDIINENKSHGGRISVAGTTVVRALESAWSEGGVRPEAGYTEKFIHSPYPFKVVDRLLTNFHQPRSTLLVLVSAFAGREAVLKAYEEAILAKYRLFSYGDCMWII
ncbi:MAG: tRNA preQ1(34) S-adenosylmethionine ribosyltransferase-isomerase QueA [Deltaproteobacteria bacterium]|nr:tRNA preQ1(34) S-adenosylmethionine ribosyltransferase-isomerase QueA [Deltaproteobacteria bacterium]